MKTLTKEQLGTAPMQCLCGWSGKASEGELREGCDVAFSEEKLAQCRENLKALTQLLEGMSQEDRVETILPLYRSLTAPETRIFVQCPSCRMTAALAGSDFEPVCVASEEVPA